MKRSIAWFGAAALVLVALHGCGGGNDGGAPAGSGAPASPPPSGQLGATLSNAAANPANDTAVSTSSAFAVLQANGVPAVTVTGAPVVNFAVFSNGKVKSDLTLSSVSFAIAKLTPGVNGNPDVWQSYVQTVQTTTGANNVGSGPGGTPVMASAVQATTDPKTSATLVYHPEGYYTYTFSTNITDPAQTRGVVFEPGKTTRIAIQLSYVNDAGVTVRVNPYYDVTFDGNGQSVPVTDPSKTHIVSSISECNKCHEKLALHGGGRVDVQYCVMCHNPGTTDPNSGNVLTMATMVHKIHAGKLLASIPASAGGGDYVIWGYQASEHNYADVGFPQDLRNCTVCHNGANPSTPQGDNWKLKAYQTACLTCHTSGTTSGFYTTHTDIALAILGPGGKPTDIPNSNCAYCHRDGTSVSASRVHFNQNEENGAKYKVTIESASYDPATRKVSVKYYVADPTNNNARYNLVTSDCTGSGAAASCPNTAQFGNLRFYLAYQNLVGQPTSVTEWTAYNNGGRDVNQYLYKGTNDGSNTYTVDLPPIPADSAIAFAQGSARVVSIGQIKEPKLQVMTATDPRPPVTPQVLINVVAQNTYADLALSGPLNPRRQVVSNEKCNVCHGALGTTSGSNTAPEAFHSGARNTVEACALCHDQNRVSTETVMTNGRTLNESYAFKRMIHGIHGTSQRIYPFTHGNNVIGPFSKKGLLLENGLLVGSTSATPPAGTALYPWPTTTVVPKDTPFGSSVLNYAAEVAYPGVGLDCNGCHVNNSWQRDPNPIGAVVAKPYGVGTTTIDPNPRNWIVITPQTASCSSCHDSANAISHMIGVGGGSYGTASQAASLQTIESCVDCHGPTKAWGVDVVHK